MRGVEDPQPAAHDVRRAKRRAVGKGKAVAHLKRDPPSIVEHLPGCRQGRPDVQVGIEGGQGLEQLGAHLGAAQIALRRRIELGWDAGQDRDLRRRTRRNAWRRRMTGGGQPEQTHCQGDTDGQNRDGTPGPVPARCAAGEHVPGGRARAQIRFQNAPATHARSLAVMPMEPDRQGRWRLV